ncbi:hypothetical protein ACJ72_00110 [Emergomyces africanus]|uniref:Uncharacterized protein n=1 Tax=Emergomyces africanus TaxID=1955775 RepID=A0A1B7P921_9EURO|nr:hypothetical protein ACJ72_00110 [Emergomyces africanus]
MTKKPEPRAPNSSSSSSSSSSSTSSTRKSRSKSAIPPHAEPQRAILMEVQPALLNRTKHASNFVKSQHLNAHRASWKPGPSPGL